MKFLSVCSGIEAASVAWNPIGWEAVGFSEIEPFPCGLLKHHYPSVPNFGDMTKFKEWPDATINVLCGGTPCQSFSVAGLRKGLDDPRGNLMLTFLAIAKRYRPTWVVWENVPGVLSSNGGRDFGSFLGGLAECGYGFAYRVLDAQYFGVAQRRKRVFVVGYLGDWHRAAAVLFEQHSLQGHPAPRREKGKRIAPTIDASFGRVQGCSGQDANNGHGHLIPSTSMCLNAGGQQRLDAESETLIPTIGGGFDAQAFDWQSGGDSRGLDPKPTAQLQACQVPAVMQASMQVRRLTPEECEALQGFPRLYTQIPWRKKPASECPDGPRYKALGNSWAVPVARWIGERINKVEAWTS
jgi:DNA (cytosine-5)-methyltransferase 1